MDRTRVLHSAIDRLPRDHFVQARTLTCAAFTDPEDAYGCLAPTAVFVALDGDRVIGQLFVYERSVILGEQRIVLGMIGDVAVSAERRGGGICKTLLLSAHNFFGERSIAFSVLFAYEPAVYRSSGYVPMRNVTRFLDKDGDWKVLVHRGGMVAELTALPWSLDPLDLNGPAV